MSPSETALDPGELSAYEQQVLASWSDTHKKSALMLFVLLALTSAPAWSGEIRLFITRASGGELSVDEQSLHRTLRRLEGLNVITHTAQSVAGTGARRKVYELTGSGGRLLDAFLSTTMDYLDEPEFIASVQAAQRTTRRRRQSSAR